MISKLSFDKFTVFTDTTLRFSEGLNVFIGENGTGKTHILKAIYAACSVRDKRLNVDFGQKLQNVFLPNSIGRLVHRGKGGASGKVAVYRKDTPASHEEAYISCRITTKNNTQIKTSKWFENQRSSAIYIPVKDMLANAPGFRSPYSQRHIHFEEVYADIVDKSLLPILKGRQTPAQQKLLTELGKAISGKVIVKEEQFFLKNKSGELEFTLLAEGYRKLGLLYKLIQNESLIKGSVLLWDEPEANLNPKLTATVVKILCELQKMGVQIFIATHDYVFLKGLSLAVKADTPVKSFSLYREDDGIKHTETGYFEDVTHNPIEEAYDKLLTEEINKNLA